MNPLRSLILTAAENDTVRHLVATAPVTRGLVDRFVAGETVASAVTATRRLVDAGLKVTLDHLGEHTASSADAERAVRDYLEMLDKLAEHGLAGHAEVSVKLSALGRQLDEQLALDGAARICEQARRCGTTVTFDMEEHTAVDSTLRTVGQLRKRWPWAGAVVQAHLRRTERDCAELAVPESRVRLCKGAYAAPGEVAYQSKHEVDLSYVRCVNTLLEGGGYPMFATHDPRLVRIVGERARWFGRPPGTYEYQMLYGTRPDEQVRLAERGETVRVYVPYGGQWYGYLMRRLAERPANTAFFLRAVASRS